MENVFSGIERWYDESKFLIEENVGTDAVGARFKVSASFLAKLGLTIAFASTITLGMINTHTQMFVDSVPLKESSFSIRNKSAEIIPTRERRTIPALTSEQVAFYSGVTTSGAFTIAANLKAFDVKRAQNLQG